MEAVQQLEITPKDHQIINESIGYRLGALREITQVLLDEVEELEKKIVNVNKLI